MGPEMATSNIYCNCLLRKNISGELLMTDLVKTFRNKRALNATEVHGLIETPFEEIKSSILTGKVMELQRFRTIEVKTEKGHKHARNRRWTRSSLARIMDGCPSGRGRSRSIRLGM